MRVAATRLLGRKAISTLGDGSLYRALDDQRRIRLFLASDKIFKELGLGLVLIDIQQCGQVLEVDDGSRPATGGTLALRSSAASGASSSAGSNSTASRHNEMVMKDISNSMLNLLRKNDSISHPKSPDTILMAPSEFLSHTLPEETGVAVFLDKNWTGPERDEEAEALVQQAVIWADDYRSVMLLLCPLEPLEGSKRPWRQARALPILGAAIGLTATAGEAEIRWMFSKLGTLGFDSEITAELESIFGIRIVAEALFLEDLRVLRLAQNSRVCRSLREERFVSVVAKNFLHFPIHVWTNLFLHIPTWTRHFNIADQADIGNGLDGMDANDETLHTRIVHSAQQSCACRNKVTAMLRTTHKALGLPQPSVTTTSFYPPVLPPNSQISDISEDEDEVADDDDGEDASRTSRSVLTTEVIPQANPGPFANNLKIPPGPKPQGFWRPATKPLASLARGPDVPVSDEPFVQTLAPASSATTCSSTRTGLGVAPIAPERFAPSPGLIRPTIWSFYGLSLRQFDVALDRLWGTLPTTSIAQNSLQVGEPSAGLKRQVVDTILAPQAWRRAAF